VNSGHTIRAMRGVGAFRSRTRAGVPAGGVCVLAALGVPVATLGGGRTAPARAGPAPGVAQTPIHHVVFLMKENRSFDQYFGKFPGADGATTGTMSDGRLSLYAALGSGVCIVLGWRRGVRPAELELATAASV
jgi:phospholipase C